MKYLDKKWVDLKNIRAEDMPYVNQALKKCKKMNLINQFRNWRLIKELSTPLIALIYICFALFLVWTIIKDPMIDNNSTLKSIKDIIDNMTIILAFYFGSVISGKK